MSARSSRPSHLGGDALTQALLPGVELGFIVATFFIVAAGELHEARAPAPQEASVPMDLTSEDTSPAADPGPGEHGPAAPVLTVAIDADGHPQYRLRGQAVSAANLPARLGDTNQVLLKVASNTPYHLFRPVLVLLSEAEVTPLLPTGEEQAP